MNDNTRDLDELADALLLAVSTKPNSAEGWTATNLGLFGEGEHFGGCGNLCRRLG